MRIKVLHQGKPQRINADFFQQQVADAFALRQALLATDTNAFRLLNGENDGFPGLIADVYAQVLVIKVYSRAWIPWFEQVADACLAVSGSNVLVLRLSRQLQQAEDLPAPWRDGVVLRGELPDPVIVFREYGVLLQANVLAGHKTGFFLDHRENRKRIGEFATGRSLLDVFSYAGGFAIHALVGGALAATCLDVSMPALEVARANAQFNGVAGRLQIVAGDAYAELAVLQAAQEKFGVVVVDPPSFAKRASEVPGALAAYRRLTRLALPLVEADGVLLLASCSARVTQEDFFALQKEVLAASGRRYEIFARTAHDLDHPIGFAEGAYLKSMYVRLQD